MRVAFTLFGDDSWTGGLNYLSNLLSAISEVDGHPVEPVLFLSPQTPRASVDGLARFLAEPPIVVSAWSQSRMARFRRFVSGWLMQCDHASLAAFRAARIDVVFQNDMWFGAAFPIPTLYWIADFQHKHLREMFSPLRRLKRDIGYAILCRLAARVMVSSHDARKDCESYLPKASRKIAVVPFAVKIESSELESRVVDVAETYSLPSQYFYFPGQLWRHKNHLRLVEALRILRDSGRHVVVVATGNPKDRRNPDYPQSVLSAVRSFGLERYFIFLGMIPYAHIIQIMRRSLALVNPSLFEGWSTTVEEAKALGVPMLLSSIGVHREQATNSVSYFDPRDSQSIADALWENWSLATGKSRAIESEREAYERYANDRARFGERFCAVVLDVANEAKSSVGSPNT